MNSVQMKLGAFLHPSGHHIAGWRHPRALANANTNFRHYAEMAATAERGKFDMLFLADSAAVRSWPVEATSRVSIYVAPFEPLTLLSALSSVTTHIGLAATATTTYNDPFHIARKFASLDHLSGGRAAWNLVTSGNREEAYNFGLDRHPLHADRYAKATEFAEVVKGLWDTWDDDAFVYDRDSGRYFLPERLHVLDHKGPHFTVRGPLNVARSPQGHPVVIQAGSSEPGKDLAAKTADVVFTSHNKLESAKSFYDDLKGRTAKCGRNPDHLKIMPGVFPVIGRTEQEARERFEELQSLVHPDVGLTLLSEVLGHVDLSPYPLDGPLPEILTTNASVHALNQMMDMTRQDKLTIRQIYLHVALGRGHRIVVGSPVQIADALEEWFRAGACDGYNILPPCLPGDLNEFVDLVVPELQARQLFRREYEGTTLRDNLGLPRPASRYASSAPEAGALA